jgi:hypothetical protein
VLPDLFCWTRFGTEAGQSIESILARKEEERRANAGIFLWGIGNAVGPSLRRLLELVKRPQVLFSPIQSQPREEDCAPSAVVAWSTACTLDGLDFAVPNSCLVTSRWDPGGPKITHYALVCRSDRPLAETRRDDALAFASLRNLVSGHQVGSSQVTAVVRREPQIPPVGREYPVAISAELVAPYFLKLADPIPLQIGPSAVWQEMVTAVWTERRRKAIATAQPLPWT